MKRERERGREAEDDDEVEERGREVRGEKIGRRYIVYSLSGIE